MASLTSTVSHCAHCSSAVQEKDVAATSWPASATVLPGSLHELDIVRQAKSTVQVALSTAGPKVPSFSLTMTIIKHAKLLGCISCVDAGRHATC